MAPNEQEKKHDHDWLPILREIVIPHAGALQSQDLKALKGTCKLMKQRIDPLFLKLELDLEAVPEPDWKAISASSLIANIYELTIRREFTGRIFGMQESLEYLVRNGPWFFQIMSNSAPRLERLNVCLEESPICMASKFLLGGIKWPCLKSFKIDVICHGFIESWQLQLLSMTNLQRLSLGMQGKISGVNATDLRVLLNFPIEQLTTLELARDSIQEETVDDEEQENLEFIAELTEILHRAENLKELGVSRVRKLDFFDSALLPKLEKFSLHDSNINTSDFNFLPRKLEYFELNSCVAELDGLYRVLSSGTHFPQLKELALNEITFGEGEILMDLPLLPDLNLPSVESISIFDCSDIYADDVFLISKAAEKLPNLKKYTVSLIGANEAEDVEMATEFFTSSICANLEELFLYDIVFDDDVLEAFVKHAPKMKMLKVLSLTIQDKSSVTLLAHAGSLGGWPMLERLMIEDLGEDTDEQSDEQFEMQQSEMEQWCSDILKPFWRNLEVSVMNTSY